mgnify:CR=1 FL=1
MTVDPLRVHPVTQKPGSPKLFFFRNCVNYAFPAMECAGVTELFDEGDVCAVDFDSGSVRNVTSGKSLAAKVLPAKLLDLLSAGGIYPLLEMKGIIEPQN